MDIAYRLQEAFQTLLGHRKVALVRVEVRPYVIFRSRIWWLALAALPVIVAACNNGSGSGY